MTSRFRELGLFSWDPKVEYFSIFVFSPDGKVLSSWDLPGEDHPCCIAFDRDRIAILTHTGPLVEKSDSEGKTHRTFKKTAVVVMDAHGKPVFHFLVAGAGLSIVEGKLGRELWVRSGMDTFDRYAMH